MKKLIVLGTAGALAAIVMACGGGSSDKTPTSAAPTTAAAKATVAATSAAEKPTESAEAAPSAAELSADIAKLKEIMNAIITKANSGDVQATRDTEGTMDDPIEATVKALRANGSTDLADKIENLELDIEHQADASTTDLTVIAKDAQAILPLLDQASTALKLTSAGAGDTVDKAAISADVKQLRDIMSKIIAKAQAGDVQGTRDTEGTMDDAMEATVKATRTVDPALADELEKLELDIEAQADASNTDLSVIIKDAQAVPAVLDKIVTALKLSA